MVRKVVFWIHLISGLVAGAVIAVMSVTGVAIAFEEEILAWCDREVRRIEPASPGAGPLSLEQLRDKARGDRPDFDVDYIVVPRDANLAYELFAKREGPLYADPNTGTLRDSRAHGVHEVLHELEEWHRWLGMHGEGMATGKLITGICNLAFLLLCVTGLYLWFPRTWSGRALRPRLWLAGHYKGKAREFNWHNVFGLWSLPVLLMLAATAVVISFGWAHRLVFTLAGEEAPKSRNFGMMAVPPPQVPTPDAGAPRLPMDQLLARAQGEVPDWRTIGVRFPSDADVAKAAPVKLEVMRDDTMPSRAYVPVELDPFTGEVLQAVRFEDRSPGLRARVWIRFLHTGAGFGLTGKIVVTLATLASLILVYTGFALSWRRFAARRR
ncbi:MAG: PepSY-associated TM helix domain-containing protein [Rariglobus sp.]